MIKLFRDILTGIDGETYDNGRVLCLASFIVYFAMAMGSIHIDKPWLPLEFAGGIGTMAVGFGINLRLKQRTEPEKRENAKQD